MNRTDGGVTSHAINRLIHHFDFPKDKKAARKFLREIAKNAGSDEMVLVPQDKAKELGISDSIFVVIKGGKVITIFDERTP